MTPADPRAAAMEKLLPDLVRDICLVLRLNHVEMDPGRRLALEEVIYTYLLALPVAETGCREKTLRAQLQQFRCLLDEYQLGTVANGKRDEAEVAHIQGTLKAVCADFDRIVTAYPLALPVAETGWQEAKAQGRAEVLTRLEQWIAFSRLDHAAEKLQRERASALPAPPEPPEGEGAKR